jgi:hypothetical protein
MVGLGESTAERRTVEESIADSGLKDDRVQDHYFFVVSADSLGVTMVGAATAANMQMVMRLRANSMKQSRTANGSEAADGRGE